MGKICQVRGTGKNFTTGLQVLRNKADGQQGGPHQTRETDNPTKKESTEGGKKIFACASDGGLVASIYKEHKKLNKK